MANLNIFGCNEPSFLRVDYATLNRGIYFQFGLNALHLVTFSVTGLVGRQLCQRTKFAADPSITAD